MTDTTTTGEVTFEGATTIRRAFTLKKFEPTSIDVANRTARFLGTPKNIDSVGDGFDPEGCKLDRFMLNPAISFNHDGQAPVGKAIAVDIVPDEGVYLTVEFTKLDNLPDDNPYKQRNEAIWAFVQKGLLVGISVEFRPIKGTRDKMIPGQTGVYYTEWEPVDWSITAKPCNMNALVKSLKTNPRETALVFPDEVAELVAGREPNTGEARMTATAARALSMADRLIDVDAATALRNGLHSINAYLRHEVKGLPETIDKSLAARYVLKQYIDAAAADRLEKAYQICLLCPDQALRAGIAEELMELGRLLGVQFIPDAVAEHIMQSPISCLYHDEPADEPSGDWYGDGDNDADDQPGAMGDDDHDAAGDDEEEACSPKRTQRKQDSVSGQADASSTPQPGDAGAVGGRSDGSDLLALWRSLSAEERSALQERAEQCGWEMARNRQIGGNRHVS